MAGIHNIRTPGTMYVHDDGEVTFFDPAAGVQSEEMSLSPRAGGGGNSRENGATPRYSLPSPFRLGLRQGAAAYPLPGDHHSSEGGGRASRNLSLSFNTPPGISPTESPEDPKIEAAFAKCIEVISENLLCHPFLVLKRQCQVNTLSRRYHLLPLTIIHPVFHICQRQGLAVLWKGLGSTLVVRGMALAAEDVLSKVTVWPKEVSRHSSMKAFFQHMLLKTLGLAVITPFYAASLVETVQSDLASETAGFFDVFREGCWRLLAWPSTGRLVPLHVLIVPTVVHGILSYLIYTGVKSVSVSIIRRVRERKEQGTLVSYYTEMASSLIGNLAADIILFPLETVLNRLHMQGTRTIIDGFENGLEEVLVISSYGGVEDCFRTTIDEEGLSGLYKGFGALMLQYGIQILLIRTVKLVLENTPLGSNTNGTASPPLLQKKYPPFFGTEKYDEPEAFAQSRSEPTAINRQPYDPLSRRTPPRRDLSSATFSDSEFGDYRYPNISFRNYSPVTIHWPRQRTKPLNRRRSNYF